MENITKEITQQLTKEKQVIPTEGICKRCSFSWKPRKKCIPIMCPHCKSKYWNIEKTRLVCARCEHEWWQKMKQIPNRCPRCNCLTWDNADLHELNRGIHWLENKIKEEEEKRTHS